MNREDIRRIVKDNDGLQTKLFRKGFFLTDASDVNYLDYPFWGQWNVTAINQCYTLAVHKELPCYIKSLGEERTIGMVGHAYDPVEEEICEERILELLAERIGAEDDFWKTVNQLTGCFCLFVAEGDRVRFLNDAAGLYSVFYGRVDSHVYVSSHSNLIGDILGLEEDPFVTKLKSCRTFYYFGNQLPGNITQFAEVKRLNPNHYVVSDAVDTAQKRFYWPHSLDKTEDEICDELVALMKKTMEMISKKWDRPALSLTGGCDSKTTLACMSDRYNEFSYFSYDSQPNELPDAEAAAAICEALGLPHTLYKIPYEDEAFEDVEVIRSILIWNGGNVRNNNPNDVRKRIYLDRVEDFDVEIKSWASEIGRSRYTKRYNGKKSFGKKPSPRKCTTFYKFLFFNRGLVNKCDKAFKEYLQAYYEPAQTNPIPWQDQFYWEWHWPSRDGVNLTCEQIYSNDITVPYNNRLVLELLLSVSEAHRVSDEIYTRIRARLDERIDRATEAIVDVNHTNKRAILETVYYYANTLLPY